MTEMQPWEKNDRFTRGLEWAEFGVRCLFAPFCGSATEYVINSLKQDYQRLREGRATYWYDRKWEKR